MNARFTAFVLIALLALQASCAAPPATSVPSPQVGFIEKVTGGVQSGPESALVDVDPMRELANQDAMRVFNNGKANVNLGYGLGFTLYNDTVAGATSVDLKGTSKQAALKLSQGGLKGYNPPGSITTVDLPIGIRIIILGTHYFITYNPSAQEAWVFNADGSVQFSVSGGSYQDISRATLVQIGKSGAIHEYSDARFTSDDFDRLASDFNSPSRAVIELVKLIVVSGKPTVTKSHTPRPPPWTPRPPTLTPSVTPSPVPPPPSGPTMNFTRNAMCRSGPSQVYEAVYAFLDGQTAPIEGRNPNFNNTWWWVRIPGDGHCWVSLVTGIATGDLSNVPIIGSGPPPIATTPVIPSH